MTGPVVPEPCGHCGYPMRLIAGVWCHTDRAAFVGPRHIAEPEPLWVAS